MHKLKEWMNVASSEEAMRLAALADTSHVYLYQIANGQREPAPDLAGRLESAAKLVRLGNQALPELTRGDLNSACKGCPYFRSCTVPATK